LIDPRSTSFGREAAAYESARPSYPEEAIELVAEASGLGPQATVVDLAAGTGKLTTLLARRFSHLTAVEPSAGMRASLQRSLPGLEPLAGSAESIPLADASADAVFVAEAFHWFDPEPAIAEISRVLTRGGTLALLSNRERWKPETNPWLTEFGELIAPLLRNRDPHPNQRGSWAPELEEIGDLEPIRRAELDNVQTVDRDRFIELISTWSFVANLEPAPRERLLERVAGLLGDQSSIELDYATELIWTRKR
jgi:SAM-dependent methyltransferase